MLLGNSFKSRIKVLKHTLAAQNRGSKLIHHMASEEGGMENKDKMPTTHTHTLSLAPQNGGCHMASKRGGK